MSDSQGPVRIVDASGVYPEALDQSVLEQKLHAQGRFTRAHDKMIFVFGSNEGGRHGAGAARYAHQFKGAQMGVGFGQTGMSFAIPTKTTDVRHTLPLSFIRHYVMQFLEHARAHPGTSYQVTAIGCGLAGLKHEQIAPMFTRAPENCFFDTAWLEYLPETASFWGTF